ncbi:MULTISPECIES: DUF3073 domain-containing protein [unclassified Frondihabitans]|jgi:hypothetical protein|uniref:DUF3073 domain-containing protein n=1 Tax=unclassified Frondihabitans TaxID=2626248 RepID=UPI0006FFB338|nr:MULTISPECIES: DUF3073 domain-containing protein [unclassified Frondihabitans]KQQ28736.1 hypothetical protein ASF54_08875 [Frondihabitans sp. Leaf304]RPE78243.1 DUF3073 family protein [Frondihabitans sp. PhB153]RPF08524.1 DUF3073 family protein [Frondihabitans sp. PhB161]
MGRGRQKAKHTKVARELKYFSPDTNYGALEKELSSPHGDDNYVDKWADEVEEDDTDDQYVDKYADDFVEHDEPQHKSA